MDTQFLLIPQSKLQNLEFELQVIKDLLLKEISKKRSFSDWLSEQEAQTLTGLKETSLWKLRKEGKVVFSKIGAKTFYSLKSVEKLLDENKE